MVKASLAARGRTLLLLAACGALWAGAVADEAGAKRSAPGAPGAKHVWAPADKHGFGTAEQRASNVWFTLRQGSLSEIYYPDLSTPGFRGLQFAVADGRGLLERETVDDDPDHIEPLAPGVTGEVTPAGDSLAFRQVTRGTGWRLTKTWITDPARATVLARVRFESLNRRPLRLYVLADPAPGDDGNDDRGITPDGVLVGYDDAAASAVAASPGFGSSSSGYRGTPSDPWRDLQDDGRMGNYDATEPGNVVQGARTELNGMPGNQEMTLAIGFGADAGAARAAAADSLAAGFATAEAAFDEGWRHYRAGLNDPPDSVSGDAGLRAVYEQSLRVLAASEDKTYPGASIAAPNMAWIWGTLTLEPDDHSGPYHLVWPRDFFHVATAQKAAGDDVGADRLLDYLWRVQKDDGSFWQNTRVDGTPKWTSQQLDETSLPVVLAWWLGRNGPEDWAHVEKAADYVAREGPDSEQERWENQGGYSPNTIAAEIAALVCAADIARRNGAEDKAEEYEALADEWQRNVEAWTVTTTGPYSPKPYYLRITKDGQPDLGTRYQLGDNYVDENGDETVDQREIVDNSFLALVLFGIKPADDPIVRNSLEVGDETSAWPLRDDTPSGPVWHRFTFDGYGEQADGKDWDLFFGDFQRQTRGRLWPLLTGERGEYELLAGNPAAEHLRTIANTSNDGLMLPEQVWDDATPPGEHEGEGTRSATPLGWTHAQFIRLAWSIDAGEPIERPAVVACRYLKELCDR